MKASLVIPTFNKLPRLKLTLASLENQNCQVENFEVIIVDDGSTDGTKEYFESIEVPFTLRYIRTINSGRSAARNKGIACAKHKIIIFADDDMILNPEYIQQHIDIQEERLRIVHGKIINLTYLKFFQDPTCGELYPHLSSRTGLAEELKERCISQIDIIKQFDKVISPNNKMTSLEIAIQEIFKRSISEMFWIGCTGGNFSVPKAWLEEVDSFDETFGVRWGGEDLELGYRLFLEGYPFAYTDKAVNYHIAHYRPRFQNDLLQSFQYFYDKHKHPNILKLLDFLIGKTDRETFISMAKPKVQY